MRGPTDEFEASKTLFYSPITPSCSNPNNFQYTLRQVGHPCPLQPLHRLH